ncbi:MAG: hypothetical protein Q8R37_06000 [Nanoarchaeota archaeon]|nr:hypothetical protein [Nanoarchaeota archaeon]
MVQRIFPSVMAKNQQELASFWKRLAGVAKTVHLDIADGAFVPNKSLWFRFQLSPHFKYAAHLMIQHPEQWITKNGSKVDLCIVHWETINNVEAFIDWMRQRKKKIAFALNPETNVRKIKPYLNDIDYILVLTVHPGFYGGRYLKTPLKKIKQIKKINPRMKIIVDGGMNPVRVKDAVRAGADYVVSGSFITKAENPKERMKLMEHNFLKSITFK